MTDINAMVNRFLVWKLPADFNPDCGISFDGRGLDARGYAHQWPIGTNLLTAEQAKAMLVHVLGDTATQRGEPTDGVIELAAEHCGECSYDAPDHPDRFTFDRRELARFVAALASAAPAPTGQPSDAAPLDICTDSDNCNRCKTHPNHRAGMEHAGIPMNKVLAKALVETMPSTFMDKQSEETIAATLCAALASPVAPEAAPVAEGFYPNGIAHLQPTIRVACVTLDGSTLTVPADQLVQAIGDDEQHTYALTFKTMTRREFEALGEFNGF